MSHLRSQIRDALEALLAESLTTAGVKLFRQRVKPLRDSRAPWVNIETDSETSEDSDEQYQEKRTLTINLRITGQDKDTVADVLDAVANVIEPILARARTLGGLVQALDYRGANPDYESAAEAECAALVMEYQCVYLWTPTVAGDDFLIANVQIDMAGPRNDPQTPTVPDGQIDASATINLPQ